MQRPSSSRPAAHSPASPPPPVPALTAARHLRPAQRAARPAGSGAHRPPHTQPCWKGRALPPAARRGAGQRPITAGDFKHHCTGVWNARFGPGWRAGDRRASSAPGDRRLITKRSSATCPLHAGEPRRERPTSICLSAPHLLRHRRLVRRDKACHLDAAVHRARLQRRAERRRLGLLRQPGGMGLRPWHFVCEAANKK